MPWVAPRGRVIRITGTNFSVLAMEMTPNALSKNAQYKPSDRPWQSVQGRPPSMHHNSEGEFWHANLRDSDFLGEPSLRTSTHSRAFHLSGAESGQSHFSYRDGFDSLRVAKASASNQGTQSPESFDVGCQNRGKGFWHGVCEARPGTKARSGNYEVERSDVASCNLRFTEIPLCVGRFGYRDLKIYLALHCPERTNIAIRISKLTWVGLFDLNSLISNCAKHALRPFSTNAFPDFFRARSLSSRASCELRLYYVPAFLKSAKYPR
jgi:hypothetical protein